METDNKNKLERKLEKIRAADIMSKFVVTIREDQTVEYLAQSLLRFKISGVPVISKEGEICGIATSTDLFRLMEKTKRDFDEGIDVSNYSSTQVKTFMVTDIATITDNMNLYEIMKLMNSKNIHTLPVMNTMTNELVGIIGRRDVLNAFYAH